MDRIYIKTEKMSILLPINPSDIDIPYENQIDTHEVIGIGEVSKKRHKKLKDISIEAFFPDDMSDLITNSDITQERMEREFIRARNKGEVIEFIYKRNGLEDISLDALVVSFHIITKAGYINKYSLVLKEYVYNGPRELQMQEIPPVQLVIPVQSFNNTETTATTAQSEPKKQYVAKAEPKPVITAEIVKGSSVLCNGKGYHFQNGGIGCLFKNLSTNFVNKVGKVNSVATSKLHAYAVELPAQNLKGSAEYYFDKGSLVKQ